jgi:DNA-binding transcriptional MerR regulator
MEYAIGEVAVKLGISISTLRYYDKQGLLPLVKRTEGNIRVFSDVDFEFLSMIECLKISGMKLKDIRKYFYWCHLGDQTIKKRYDMFQERKKEAEKQLAELENSLELINYKCEFYRLANEAGTTNLPELKDLCKPAAMDDRKKH